MKNYTRDDLISIKYEGGKAGGTAGSVYPHVTVVFHGNRGEEERYERTTRTDPKGRVIFALSLPNA
jgi:hypothetical protein